MKIQTIDDGFAFCGQKGGIKYLKLSKNKNNIRFTETAKEAADVAVFIAGGQEIDRMVHNANLRAMHKKASKPVTSQKEPGIFKLFEKLFRHKS